MCLVTLCITIAVIHTIKAVIDVDPFSLTFWGFVPVGAVCVALAAISGYMLAAARMNWQSDIWDLLFLMVTCLMLQVLLVGSEYVAILMAGPQEATPVGFGRFFSDSLTQAEYTIHSRQFGTSRAHLGRFNAYAASGAERLPKVVVNSALEPPI